MFSFVGYAGLEEVVGSRSIINVTLTPDVSSLNEVVVVGYGTQKKRDLTGSVGLVDSKTIEALKPVKVEQALQGTVSGVNVTSQSGAPGAGLDIRIRGIATNGDLTEFNLMAKALQEVVAEIQ